MTEESLPKPAMTEDERLVERLDAEATAYGMAFGAEEWVKLFRQAASTISRLLGENERNERNHQQQIRGLEKVIDGHVGAFEKHAAEAARLSSDKERLREALEDLTSAVEPLSFSYQSIGGYVVIGDFAKMFEPKRRARTILNTTGSDK